MLALAAGCVLLGASYALQKAAGGRTGGVSVQHFITGWKKEDVRKIEIYRGSPSAESVILEKAGEEWKLPNLYQSRVDLSTLDSFFDAVLSMEGEPRGESQELHKELGLEKDKALHILFHGDGKVLEHLLVGKRAPGFNRSFVRREAENMAYVVTSNLNQKVGCSSDEEKPSSQTWADLAMWKLDKEKIEHISLLAPGTLFELERKEKPSEAQPGDGKDSQGKDGAKDEKKKEYTWHTETRALQTYKLREDRVRRLLDTLSSVRGKKVADPAKLDEYELRSPAYTAQVRLEGGQVRVLRIGKEVPGESETRYARADDGPVFTFSQWTIDDIFPRGKDLFEFPRPELPETLQRIRIEGPRREIVIEYQQNRFAILSPDVKRYANPNLLQQFLNRLLEFTPADLAIGVDRATCGLDNPEYRLVWTAPDVPTFEIRVSAGGPRPKTRYVGFSNSEKIYFHPEDDALRLVPPLKDFVEIKPFAKEKDSLQELRLTEEGLSAVFERGENWRAAVFGFPVPVQQGELDQLLDFFDDVTIEDILSKPPELGSPVRTIEFTRPDGRPVKLEFFKGEGNLRYLRAGEQVWAISTYHYDKATTKAESLFEKVLFKNRDKLQSARWRTEGGEKALDVAKLPEITVVRFAASATDSGIDASKTALILAEKKERTGPGRQWTIRIGNAPKDAPNQRYLAVEGASGVAVADVSALLKLAEEAK